MQYLSKAYSYYSGINPATLSGAIDVVVVRHVDDNGDVVFSSSPFHVRFGKLQVLRAGEKRVTVRLPNNLPPPHTAPFGMKVGETGEAFFVLETDEVVPEELLTSPVVMASDAAAIAPTPPRSDHKIVPNGEDLEQIHTSLPSVDGQSTPPGTATGLSLTQQPFGETEKQVRHDERGDDVLIEGPKSVENTLGDVDFLDLDAAGNKMRPNEEDELDRRINPVPDDHLGKPPAGVQTTSDSSTSAVSPSSLLNTATAFIPSIPFLSSSSRSSKSASPEKARGSSSFASMRLDGRDQRQGVDGTIDKQDSRPDSRPEVPSFQAPPNPMAAQAGESTALPSRDGTLSSYSKELDASYDRRNALEGLEMLPKVEAGEGEGPDVLYGKHLVLDMAGYHSTRKATEEEHTQVEAAGGKEAERIQQSPPQMEDGEKRAVADSDAQTIIKGSLIDTFAHDLISSIHPPITSLLSPSQPLLPSTRTASTTISQVVPVDEKMLQPAQPGASPFSMSDLPKAIDALSLESGNLGVVHTHSQSRRRNDRGHSEPPQFPEDSNNLSISVPPRSELLDSSSPPMSDTFSGTSIQRSALITASAASNADMDYAWDWGRVSSQSNEEDIKDSQQPSREMERSSSGPPATNGETSEQRMRNDSSTSAGMDLATSAVHRGTLASLPGKLKNVEDSPFMFVLDMDDGRSHSFELALCGERGFALLGDTSDDEETTFLKNRVSFQNFIEDPQIVDDPRLVVRYSLLYLTWSTGYRLLLALATYRRSLTPPYVPSDAILPPLTDIGIDPTVPPRPTSGYGWSRWWRRGQSGATGLPPANGERRQSVPGMPNEKVESPPIPLRRTMSQPSDVDPAESGKHYAKTLRLSSDQLKALSLKSGPNTVQFSVTSSYSGVAICTARIFLWDETDQIVISDIDGTITKSDALGHVFAAIGRDWTHGGIAKLYTDICNNGYKIMYLTSRAIGQADSTREYLNSIIQGEYRLPEGPVIMSPDRLMASLHREVIMRKPELFKMACLRDIQRLFAGKAKEAFFAGFGNRITDAMSYRSVGIEAAKIYTIDSTGVVKTELLQAAGHQGSYMGLNHLVNEVFPPVNTKVKPEFTDFNYWRSSVIDVALPDLTPPSPALSARSDTSSRLSTGMLGKIASIGRRSSKQPLLPMANTASSRPSSPLMGPAMTSDDLSETDEDEVLGRRSTQSSMPGSFEDKGGDFPNSTQQAGRDRERDMEGRNRDEIGDDGNDERMDEGDPFDDGAIFDDDILATGEMKNVPF